MNHLFRVEFSGHLDIPRQTGLYVVAPDIKTAFALAEQDRPAATITNISWIASAVVVASSASVVSVA